MRYNQYMVSNAMGKKTYYKEKNNILIKMVRLLNKFHSIELCYYPTEIDREKEKISLRKRIERLSKHIGSSYRPVILLSLKNKEYWEITREYMLEEK